MDGFFHYCRPVMRARRNSLPIALAREASAFWTRAFRDGDGVRWAAVRRCRELFGIEDLERVVASSTQTAPAIVERDSDDFADKVGSLTKVIETLRNDLEAAGERELFTEWVASVPLVRQPLVSIVLATLGEREATLTQALQSIVDQRYENFEVVVVAPAGFSLPSKFATDGRFTVVTEARNGIGRARNLGLANCSGEFVTYADDDNSMGPHWLTAVVWAFTTDSEVDVVYGARLHQHVGGQSAPEPAFWWFERVWNAAVLPEFNPIDTQALAHRAGLSEAVWDEELPSCVDWELVIRLTASGRVRPLPVRACTYTTNSPGRITDRLNTVDVRDEVRRRAKSSRRLRLLAVSHSFPRSTEYYVESELEALRPRFEIALANEYEPFPGVVSSFPHLGSVEQGIDSHHPDLVLFHYADVALRNRDKLIEFGIPYAVRIHSYDANLAKSNPFASDPLFLGCWVYACDVKEINKSFELPSLVHDAHNWPQSFGGRSGVVYASSCLPKRDWNLVEEILVGLVGMERTMFLGTCHGSEDLPRRIVDQFRHADPRIAIACDVPNVDVVRSMTLASATFYSASSNHRIGNPRSVVEAWIAGAIPILPDSDDAHFFAGDHARYYTDAQQAIELIRELNDPGQDLRKERLANMNFALENFAAAEVLDRFANQLGQEFTKWERSNA